MEGVAPVCVDVHLNFWDELYVRFPFKLWNPEVGMSFHLSWRRSGFRSGKQDACVDGLFSLPWLADDGIIFDI